MNCGEYRFDYIRNSLPVLEDSRMESWKLILLGNRCKWWWFLEISLASSPLNGFLLMGMIGREVYDDDWVVVPKMAGSDLLWIDLQSETDPNCKKKRDQDARCLDPMKWWLESVDAAGPTKFHQMHWLFGKFWDDFPVRCTPSIDRNPWICMRIQFRWHSINKNSQKKRDTCSIFSPVFRWFSEFSANILVATVANTPSQGSATKSKCLESDVSPGKLIKRRTLVLFDVWFIHWSNHFSNIKY